MATFGKTDIGASTTGFPNDSSFNQQVFKAICSEVGVATKFTWYGKGSSTNTTFKMVVYADSAGSPGALLATSSQVSLLSTDSTLSWRDVTFSFNVAAATYWIGYISNSADGGGAAGAWYYDSPAGTNRRYKSRAYASGPSDPYGTPGGSDSILMSLYVTYDATPVNSAAPTVSGSTPVGSTLSSTTGTWSQSPSFTYAWTRDGTPIGGATSSTYLTVSADAGHAVGCTVTATNGVASASQASSNTISVTAATHRSQPVPQRRRRHTGRRGR